MNTNRRFIVSVALAMIVFGTVTACGVTEPGATTQRNDRTTATEHSVHQYRHPVCSRCE